MTPMLTVFQVIRDDVHFFDLIKDIFSATRERVEGVVGRGNSSWVLLVLLAFLVLWYRRRQHLTSL